MTTPQPMNITICMGSSCFSRGNNRNIEVIQSFLESRHLPAKVELAGYLCAGQCRQGPNLVINGEPYHEVDPVSVIRLLNQHLPEGNPWTT